jgi:hypothetical protein
VALNINKASKYKGSISALENIKKKQPDYLSFTNTLDVLVRAVGSVMVEMQDSLVKKKSNATGSLSQSIIAKPNEATKERISVQIFYNKYGDELDKGRKAEGFTKENEKKLQPNIYRWIISPGKQKAFGTWGTEKKKARSLSYIIAKRILEKGTKGNKWLTDVIGENNDKLNKFISSEISKALKKDVEVVIKNEVENINGNNS